MTIDRLSIHRAMRSVLVALGKQDVSPSAGVVNRAGLALVAGRVGESSSAIVYPVISESEVYDVCLVFDGRGYIVFKRCTCTCEAGRAKKLCYHLLSALTYAAELGYEVKA